ncbi:hypothetical protein R1flu_028344 [Riccia fluitans]|uniref:DUF4378 domain-containing protein n=1 Tax=Riccia fluitans TaxID=41844 RepID=A0ABD1XLE8_9MARC
MCHLFDVVNELLTKKLGPYRNPRNRPTGKMLLEEIWRDITDQIGRMDPSLMVRNSSTCSSRISFVPICTNASSGWIPSPDFDTFVDRIDAELENRIFHDFWVWKLLPLFNLSEPVN